MMVKKKKAAKKKAKVTQRPVKPTKTKPKKRTPKRTEQKAAKATHIALILDRSGSMGSIRDQAIDLFNEQLTTLQGMAAKGGTTKLSLFLFGGDYGPGGTEEAFFEQPVDRAAKLDRTKYVPDGVTPMYDGVGRALNRLAPLDTAGDVGFLVIIISDGLENASQEWTATQIAAKVTDLKATGRWTFAYLGANQDLADVAKHLGLTQRDTAAFASTVVGTQNLSMAAAGATHAYMVNRGQGATVSNYAQDVASKLDDK